MVNWNFAYPGKRAQSSDDLTNVTSEQKWTHESWKFRIRNLAQLLHTHVIQKWDFETYLSKKSNASTLNKSVAIFVDEKKCHIRFHQAYNLIILCWFNDQKRQENDSKSSKTYLRHLHHSIHRLLFHFRLESKIPITFPATFSRLHSVERKKLSLMRQKIFREINCK